MAGILTDRDKLVNARASNAILRAQLSTERARLNHLIDTACLLPAGGQWDMKPIEIRLVINEGAVFPNWSRYKELDLQEWPDADAIRILVKDRADSEIAQIAEARESGPPGVSR